MIIRPACEREFVALPNAIFNDRRLSVDTRAMVALILSKSKSWEVRPGPLARALSREDGKPVGRKRLARMFREAMQAGYMARSAQQTHQDDGSFGRYVYFVGMPDDVAAEIAKGGVTISAQFPDAHTPDAHTPEGTTTHKIQNSKNSSLPSFPPTIVQAETLHGRPKEASATESYDDNASQEGNHPPVGTLFGEARPAPKRRLERSEVVQDRIATRLGPRGWTILMAMTASELDQLTAQERAGKLTDEALVLVHARFPAPHRRDTG